MVDVAVVKRREQQQRRRDQADADQPPPGLRGARRLRRSFGKVPPEQQEKAQGRSQQRRTQQRRLASPELEGVLQRHRGGVAQAHPPPHGQPQSRSLRHAEIPGPAHAAQALQRQTQGGKPGDPVPRKQQQPGPRRQQRQRARHQPPADGAAAQRGVERKAQDHGHLLGVVDQLQPLRGRTASPVRFPMQSTQSCKKTKAALSPVRYSVAFPLSGTAWPPLPIPVSSTDQSISSQKRS